LPLFEKARIEVYLPDVPKFAYHDLLESLEQEFTYAFGGCTMLRGLDGSYLARRGMIMKDRVNLLYTDAPFDIEGSFHVLARYTDELRRVAFAALEEEAVLVALVKVYHSS
jgi:hypothetical protein